jgi:hypothetical protein
MSTETTLKDIFDHQERLRNADREFRVTQHGRPFGVQRVVAGFSLYLPAAHRRKTRSDTLGNESASPPPRHLWGLKRSIAP